MLTLHVDSSLIPGVNAPITVDALLSAVESVLGQAGRIVTALRINGVDEPAFRERHVLALALREEDSVALDTTPLARLACQALEDALHYLPEISGSAKVMAAHLRGSAPDAVRPALGNLADNLALLTALVHTADLWGRQAGLAATDWLGDDVAAVEQAAGQLGSAAAVEDWHAAARVLEHDLPVALDGWCRRLATGHEDVLALQALPTA